MSERRVEAPVHAVLSDRELFAVLYPTLRRFASVVGPLRSEPDDLVQEALMRAMGRGPIVDLADPANYLRQAIVNIARDEWRRDRRWRARLSLNARADAQRDVYASDLGDLYRLEVDERAVVFLVDVEGFTHEEAAALLGCSAATARKRASRGRQRLAHFLESEQ